MLAIMRWSFRHYIIILVGLGLLWFFINLGTSQMNENISLLETRWSLEQKLGSQSAQNLQENSYDVRSRVSHLTYRFLAGALPLKKKSLTVGLSSMQGPSGRHLMSTLTSVFRVSSENELRQVTVLVHLADSDPDWLNETASTVVRLFTPQILRGQLLLINAPPAAYQHLWSQPHTVFNFSDVKTFRAKQMLDYAFLASFAANLSDYFLMLEDNVQCARGFVSAIQQEVEAHRGKTWAIMETANRGLVGKLCHSGDLPRLAAFLLLFYPDESPEALLFRFRRLQGQNYPLRMSPALFARFDDSSSFSSNGAYACGVPGSLEVGEGGFDVPDNPPALIYTDMKTLQSHLPQNAYSPDGTFFLTRNALPGHQLTVVLDKGTSVIRVQVLTGTARGKLWSLEEGKVELGSHPTGELKHCTKYSLLGQLWDGQLDCRVRHRPTGRNVSCVRLVVTSPRESSWLMVRHVNIWVRHEE